LIPFGNQTQVPLSTSKGIKGHLGNKAFPRQERKRQREEEREGGHHTKKDVRVTEDLRYLGSKGKLGTGAVATPAKQLLKDDLPSDNTDSGGYSFQYTLLAT
jgi:hypothetical protein